MAVVPRSHAPFLPADAVIGGMQPGSPRAADLTAPHLLMNARVLIGEPTVDLHAPGMVRLPWGVRKGRGREAGQRDSGGDGGEDGADGFDIKGAPRGTIAGVVLRPIRGLSGVNNVAGTGPVTIITKS